MLHEGDDIAEEEMESPANHRHQLKLTFSTGCWAFDSYKLSAGHCRCLTYMHSYYNDLGKQKIELQVETISEFGIEWHTQL